MATSAAGSIRIEIQDETGRPIPGFTLEDSEERYGDEITVAQQCYYGMKTTIDGAGRTVVPKAVRDRLALTAGAEIEVELVGDGVLLRSGLCTTHAPAECYAAQTTLPLSPRIAPTDAVRLVTENFVMRLEVGVLGEPLLGTGRREHAAHEPLISRETIAAVPLTGLSLDPVTQRQGSRPPAGPETPAAAGPDP